jgi:hypothetical protein
MLRKTFGAAVLAAAAVSPLSAQTWQTIGAPNNSNTGNYWNNASYDNVGSAVCNSGAILTNTPALAASSCVNQGPVYLPLNPAPLTTSNVFLGGTTGANGTGSATGNNPGGFRFLGGTYNINLVGRISGDLSTSWGIITDAGTSISAATLAAGPVSITGPFAIWMTQALPALGAGTRFNSTQQTGTGAIGGRTATINQQFAVFTNATGVGALGGLSYDAFGTIINSTSTSAAYFVGMEDNVNCGRGFVVSPCNTTTQVSDRDYNDIIIRIQAVPEPATVGLMGFGLLALAGVAKRRKA